MFLFVFFYEGVVFLCSKIRSVLLKKMDYLKRILRSSFHWARFRKEITLLEI